MSEVNVTFETTPNPQSMKFTVNQDICNESIFFDDTLKANRSPLANKIFGFPWASAVFLGTDFVTITKEDWVDWDTLAEPLCGLIQEHFERGEAVLHPEDSLDDDSNDSPIVKQIKNVLNNEIRPAVAMDGGDIVFHRYENQIVYIFMQGACAGCPSSTLTLKSGIETRMKEAIPEIKEVVAL